MDGPLNWRHKWSHHPRLHVWLIFHHSYRISLFERLRAPGRTITGLQLMSGLHLLYGCRRISSNVKPIDRISFPSPHGLPLVPGGGKGGHSDVRNNSCYCWYRAIQHLSDLGANRGCSANFGASSRSDQSDICRKFYRKRQNWTARPETKSELGSLALWQSSWQLVLSSPFSLSSSSLLPS